MAMNFVYTWFWTNMDRHISEAQEVAGKAGSSWNVWKPLMGSPLSSLKIFVTVATRLSPFGYGSIPINTIFRGMNIHLPAILMWTTGVQGFDTLPFDGKTNRIWCFYDDSPEEKRGPIFYFQSERHGVSCIHKPCHWFPHVLTLQS